LSDKVTSFSKAGIPEKKVTSYPHVSLDIVCQMTNMMIIESLAERTVDRFSKEGARRSPAYA
jgi:hypothetical protein